MAQYETLRTLICYTRLHPHANEPGIVERVSTSVWNAAEKVFGRKGPGSEHRTEGHLAMFEAKHIKKLQFATAVSLASGVPDVAAWQTLK